MNVEYWLSVFLPYYDGSNCIVARRPKLFPVNNGQIKQLPGDVFVCCAHEISSISHTHKYPFDMKGPKQKREVFRQATLPFQMILSAVHWTQAESTRGDIIVSNIHKSKVILEMQ